MYHRKETNHLTKLKVSFLKFHNKLTFVDVSMMVHNMNRVIERQNEQMALFKEEIKNMTMNRMATVQSEANLNKSNMSALQFK